MQQDSKTPFIQPGVSTTSKWVGSLGGGLICLMVILAMFTCPEREIHSITTTGTTSSSTTSSESECTLNLTVEGVFGLFVLGMVSGTFGGMLGMGGGVLNMSCLLLFFGLHPGVARFAALLSYFSVALGASYQYFKLKLVMRDVVKILVPSGVVGIILGAIIGHYLARGVMVFFLGIFLLFIAVVMAKRILYHRYGIALLHYSPVDEPEDLNSIDGAERRSVKTASEWIIAACGFPGGLVAAMLGISGGIVSNPLQQVLAKIPIRNAIPNTLVTACFMVPIACIMILVLGLRAGQFEFWHPFIVSICLIPGSLIGSQLGPELMKRMSVMMVHILFGVMVLFMGIYMLFIVN